MHTCRHACYHVCNCPDLTVTFICSCAVKIGCTVSSKLGAGECAACAVLGVPLFICEPVLVVTAQGVVHSVLGHAQYLRGHPGPTTTMFGDIWTSIPQKLTLYAILYSKTVL